MESSSWRIVGILELFIVGGLVMSIDWFVLSVGAPFRSPSTTSDPLTHTSEVEASWFVVGSHAASEYLLMASAEKKDRYQSFVVSRMNGTNPVMYIRASSSFSGTNVNVMPDSVPQLLSIVWKREVPGNLEDLIFKRT